MNDNGSHMKRFLFTAIAAIGLLPFFAWAGGGPLNVLVVVNSASRDSRALGAYYAQKRGIPASHLCTVKVDPRAPSISRDDFDREIRGPIRDHVARNGLSGQIHYVVLCMGIPTRVDNHNGITSSLFYGFKSPLPNAPRCNVAPDSVNQYYGSEIAYTSSAGWNRTNEPIAFVLTADTLETAKKVVDRAVASDSTFPEGVFCLYGSSDAARNVRHRSFPAAARLFALHGRPSQVDSNPSASPIPGRTVVGFMTGLAYLPESFASLDLAPGAIAEHLTSCAGMLPDPCLGQSTVWDWMRLGAAASYGTVSEPCAFREKFPDPLLFFWYSRGFTAGEALAMSVRNPYQGIWVGDPLAAPFAAPPSVQLLSPESDAELEGTANLRIAAKAHDRGAPPVFLDLYLDGIHHAPVARPFAPIGNRLVAEIGTNSFDYSVAPGEDLFAAVAGLAWAINSKGGGNVTAKATADRIEIAVRSPLGPGNEPLAFAVSAHRGFAPDLHLDGLAGTDRLLVEDGLGRAAASFHLGSAREFEIEYPLDVSSLEPGSHVLTLVVRDGTAMQCQSQFDLPFRVPPR